MCSVCNTRRVLSKKERRERDARVFGRGSNAAGASPPSSSVAASTWGSRGATATAAAPQPNATTGESGGPSVVSNRGGSGSAGRGETGARSPPHFQSVSAEEPHAARRGEQSAAPQQQEQQRRLQQPADRPERPKPPRQEPPVQLQSADEVGVPTGQMMAQVGGTYWKPWRRRRVTTGNSVADEGALDDEDDDEDDDFSDGTERGPLTELSGRNNRWRADSASSSASGSASASAFGDLEVGPLPAPVRPPAVRGARAANAPLTVLCVGEKPSVAQSLATVLAAISDSGGSLRTAGGASGGSPVHEVNGTFRGEPCVFRVTSVTGHVYRSGMRSVAGAGAGKRGLLVQFTD